MKHANRSSEELEPAWDVARLFPPQGSWSEEEYLDLPGNRLIELDDGRVEVLEMPSELHQFLVLFLYEALVAYVRQRNLGWVVVAPMPVRLWEHKLREPDVLFMRREHAARRRGTYWIGADLVMEVMSPDDPKRDKDTKREEYARAGIPEYWLVDVVERTVTVFVGGPMPSSTPCTVFSAWVNGRNHPLWWDLALKCRNCSRPAIRNEDTDTTLATPR